MVEFSKGVKKKLRLSKKLQSVFCRPAYGSTLIRPTFSVNLSILDNRKRIFFATINFDGVVKSPISALRCIPLYCDVR